MGNKRNTCRILVGKPGGKHWEDGDTGVWKILKLILER
jgi:predicted NUDIX family NTP pyrophosphohydrolase